MALEAFSSEHYNMQNQSNLQYQQNANVHFYHYPLWFVSFSAEQEKWQWSQSSIFLSLKLWLFPLKPGSSTTSELPRMRSSFETNATLRLKFSDANCITRGLLCYSHAPCTKEPILRMLPLLLLNAAVTFMVFGYEEWHTFKVCLS